MAHFETDAEVYDQLGGILTNLVGSTTRLEQMRQADAIVQFAFRSPDAKVTLDLRAGKEPRVELGDSRTRPDVVFSMDADTGHALLHGELSTTVAFARGAVRLKGPVGKALRVVPALAGADEVEPDQPVEAVVAGAEPEEALAAEAPEAEASEASAPEVEETDAEAPAEGAEAPAERAEGAEAPSEAAEDAAPVEDEAAPVEAADAAGGGEPPATPEQQG